MSDRTDTAPLPAFEPEAPNRYVVFSPLTGSLSQHVTKVQAVLAYGRMLREIDHAAPRPQILEWINGDWRAS